MSKKKLFYKAIIWQIIGITWISLFSYFWFGSLSRSIIFSIITKSKFIFSFLIKKCASNVDVNGEVDINIAAKLLWVFLTP